MQHDLQLRPAARAIYDACLTGEEWALVGVDEVERHGTVHHRQAADAGWQARSVPGQPMRQLALFGER